MDPRPRPRRRSKIILAAVSVLLTLACLEIGLRVLDVVRGDTADARAAWYWGWEQDPYLGYRGRANVEIRTGTTGLIRHNGEGFRDERTLGQIRAIEGRRLIVCVGESSTYGLGTLEAKDAYPARLEARLRASTGTDDIYVFNAGVPGYASYETVALLQLRILNHRPDAVVMMNLHNDVEYVGRKLDDDTDYGSLRRRMAPLDSTPIGEFLMRSSLVAFVANRFVAGQPNVWEASPAEQARPVTERGVAFYVDNLALAALLCRRADVPLLLVDQPIFDDTFPDVRRRQTRRMRDAMKAAAREHRIPLLDADRPMHDEGFVSPHDVHLGKEGYDRLAAILVPQVARVLTPPEHR